MSWGRGEGTATQNDLREDARSHERHSSLTPHILSEANRTKAPSRRGRTCTKFPVALHKIPKRKAPPPLPSKTDTKLQHGANSFRTDRSVKRKEQERSSPKENPRRGKRKKPLVTYISRGKVCTPPDDTCENVSECHPCYGTITEIPLLIGFLCVEDVARRGVVGRRVRRRLGRSIRRIA